MFGFEIFWHQNISEKVACKMLMKLSPGENLGSHFYYRVLHGFGQAKVAYGGLVLSSIPFPLLPQLPPKMNLAS